MESGTEQNSCCVRKSERARDGSCETERRKGQQDEELIFAEADAVICGKQHRRKILADNRLGRDCSFSTPSPPFSLMGGETENACSTS